MAVAALEIHQPDQPVRSVPLDRPVLRVGRSQESEVQILDGRVSKRHAEIHQRDGRYLVVDVGSKAGVLVNGTAVKEHGLCDGDEIGLGPACPVRIVYRGEPSRPKSTTDLASGTAILSTLSVGVGRDGLERLAKFFEFSRQVGDTFELGDVLHSVVDLAIEVTGAERGMVVLTRPDDTLEVRVARAPGGRELPIGGLRVSETIVRQTLEQRQPRVVSDIGADLDLAQAQSVVSLELRSVVTLPLSRQAEGADGEAEVFGVLYLDSRQRHATFGRFDMGILEALARDASSVIENARLLREAEEKRRMEQELKTARDVQATLLPDEFRGAAHFDVAGTCVPCHDLGGDYIDQFELPDGRCAFVVADVCGKGIPASLLAAALQGALCAEIGEDRPLREIVARVNRVLCRLTPVGRFTSMLLCVLSADGTVRYVNAGHCAFTVVTARGVEKLVTKGLALGIDGDLPYREAELRLSPGDAFVLFSDGVLEAEDAAKQLFGEERLDAVLLATRGRSAAVVMREVVDAVAAFTGDAPVSDDLSLLVVRYSGG